MKRHALAVGLVALAAALLTWWPMEGLPPGSSAALRSQDSLFVLREVLGWNRPPVSDRIVVLAVDAMTVARPELQIPMAEWAPFHRRVIEALGRAGVTKVLVDLIQPYEGPEVRDFGLALHAHPVVLAVDLDEASGRWSPSNNLLAFAAGKGVFSEGGALIRLPLDPDGVVRRTAFLYAYEVPGQDDANLATLWFQGARAGLGLDLEVFASAWKSRGDGILTLPDRAVPLVWTPARKGEGLRARESMLVNYPGPSGTFPRVSYAEVLDHADDPGWMAERFRDRIVFLGVTLPDYQDYHFTPMEDVQRWAGALRPEDAPQRMPGVEIQASAANTLLTGRFLRPLEPLTAAAWALLACLAAATLGYRGHLAGLLALLVGLYAAALAAFCLDGLLLPVAWPLTGAVLAWGGAAALRQLTVDAQRRQMRSLLRRYVSDRVADLVLQDPDAAALGGRAAEVTLLFSDLNGFTTWSERTEPEAVVAVMNEYFTAMEEVIFRRGGTLKQFVGDEIMVIFGAPFPQPDAEERAVRTALEMQAELRRMGDVWAARGIPRLEAKIGVHRGRVVTGNVGSPRRTEYAAVGDAVNLASRVMGLTKSLGHMLLITDAIYERVKDLVEVTEFPPQPVKGREQPVRVYGLDRLRDQRQSPNSTNGDQ